MNTVDGVMIVLCLFYVYLGWRKGIKRVLLSPVALVTGIGLSVAYFFKTYNLVLSVVIGIFVPVIIKVFGSIFISLAYKAKGEQEVLTPLDRACGSFLNLAWSGGMLLLTMTFLVVIPFEHSVFNTLRAQILNAKTYQYVSGVLTRRFPIFGQLKKPLALTQTPSTLQGIQQTKEYQELVDNEHIQALIEDEEALNQIQQKDFAKLMSNPHVVAIMKDKALLEKFMRLNKMILERKLNIPEKTTESES